jgi:hypothetical protein
MHDIKYFFLNKNNQTIQGGKKNFQGGKLPKTLPKSTIFQNPRGARAPPWISLGPPLVFGVSFLVWKVETHFSVFIPILTSKVYG